MTKAKRTTELLADIAAEQEKDADETVSLHEFSSRLGDRGFGLGIFLFALPNTPPLGIPGISSICAVPIAIFALQMLLGKPKLSLPRWIGEKRFQESSLKFAIRKTLPVLKWIEKLLRPRWPAMTSRRAERVFAIFIIIHAAVIFLPIPGGNFMPAFCMCLMALALLEKDGLAIFIGMLASIFVLAGMSAVIFLAVKTALLAVLGMF